MRSTADSSNRREWAIALAVAAVLALVLWLAARLLMPALRLSDQSSVLANRFGATVERLDPATAQKLGDGAEADELVVTSVAEGGPADRAGVRAGDVIESVAGRPVGTASEFASASGGGPVKLVVNRGGDHVMLVLADGGADQGRR
jgi:S1-C subfamily serine protease